MDRPWAADLDACVCNFCISPCRVVTVLTVTVHLQQSSASSITLITARGCSEFVGRFSRAVCDTGAVHRPLQRSALAVAACCSQPVAGEDVDLLSSSTWLPGSGLNDLRTAWPSLLTDLHALNPKPQTPN